MIAARGELKLEGLQRSQMAKGLIPVTAICVHQLPSGLSNYP